MDGIKAAWRTHLKRAGERERERHEIHSRDRVLVSGCVPFRINKLVTRLRASRGDFELKNLGVRLGGRVSGLRLPVPIAPVPASQARSDPCGCK